MKFILRLLAMLLITQAASAQKVYKADSDQIHYVGRTEKCGDGAVRFDWVGTQLRFRFTGTECSLRARDTKSSFYHVFIDGELAADINVTGADTLINLCRSIEGGVHSVVVFKRTEGSEGMTTVREVVLGGNGVLLPPVAEPERKIEFIGNSITCGFGVESDNPYEAYTPDTENAYYSYASITARNFNADCSLIAHSGEGVVHNYGDSKAVSAYTMQQRFRTLYDTNPAKEWDFSVWKPNVVVINLGTNDFSQKTQPTVRQFVIGYKALLCSVREVYGDIPILCLSSPMAADIQHEAVEQACREAKDANVHFIPMHPCLLSKTTDMGVSFHPNRSGQAKMAAVLTAYLSSIMNWETIKPAER